MKELALNSLAFTFKADFFSNLIPDVGEDRGSSLLSSVDLDCGVLFILLELSSCEGFIFSSAATLLLIPLFLALILIFRRVLTIKFKQESWKEKREKLTEYTKTVRKE